MWTAPQPECSGSLKQPTLWRSRVTTLPHAARTAVRQPGTAQHAVLGLLVRRNILDQLNQTLAVLPPCAEADSLADLEMETQRAYTQIEQVRQSFSADFERLSSISFSSSIKVLTSLN